MEPDHTLDDVTHNRYHAKQKGPARNGRNRAMKGNAAMPPKRATDPSVSFRTWTNACRRASLVSRRWRRSRPRATRALLPLLLLSASPAAPLWLPSPLPRTTGAPARRTATHHTHLMVSDDVCNGINQLLHQHLVCHLNGSDIGQRSMPPQRVFPFERLKNLVRCSRHGTRHQNRELSRAKTATKI